MQQLKRGDGVAFGIVQTIPSTVISELAVWSGFDFVIVDCEHGIVDEAAQLACLQVAAGAGAIAGVRVKADDFESVGRYLDHGAQFILMPGINSAKQAGQLVAASQTGPNGTRSATGSARATRYGLSASPRPVLLAMIESAQAVDQAEAIAATSELDGVIIGPNGLSADLECGFSDAAYVAAFEKIEAAARQSGVLLGSKPHASFTTERLLAGGHRFIIASADITALRDGYRTHLDASRRNTPK